MSPQRAPARPTGAVVSLADPPQVVPPRLVFADRRDAGRRLARVLRRRPIGPAVVLAIPRGGVPVAAEVADALGMPLDVAIVRKVGAPQNPEYAIGAIAEGGVRIVGDETVRALGLTAESARRALSKAESELRERTRELRGELAPIDLRGRTAIVVDDGLATGHTARAAIEAARRRGAARVILAVPVAAPSSVRALAGVADEVVCLEEPSDLWAVGYWYEDFRAPDPATIGRLLRRFGSPRPGHEQDVRGEEAVEIAAGSVLLSGRLGLPAEARSVVAFAHGSGSSRLSPRNLAVARALEDAGHATLLFDLLSDAEAADRRNVFDIELLAERLLAAVAWLSAHERTAGLPLALFGASTGAAAALTAAAALGEGVCAVVSRGGRPDLAIGLEDVRAPTLLIVGGADTEVLELNRRAFERLRCRRELIVVPGATHLFEEQGALESVTASTIDWLERHALGRRV